jgi:hypothetical protein
MEAAYSDLGELILWDLESAGLIRKFGYTELAVVFDVAMSQDGSTVLSGSSEQTIVQWRLDNPTLDKLVARIEENRFVHEPTSEERAMRQIELLCEED